MSGNIYRRGKTWWGRLQVRGVEYRRSLRTADEATAKLALADWKAQLGKGEGGGDATWRAAVVAWSETIGSMEQGGGGLKPRVRDRYLDSLRLFDHFWCNKRLSEIGRREIADFIRERKKGFVRRGADGKLKQMGPVSNYSVLCDLTAASSVFRVAVASGMCDHNPAREWDRKLVRPRKRVMVPPTLEAIETVASYATGNVGRLILFAANTGMRLMEAVTLDWREVREDRGEVLLTQTKVSRPRVVKLKTPGGDATGTLAGTPRHIRSHLVFGQGVDGEQLASPAGAFRHAMQRAINGEAVQGRALRRFRFHDLRHAFAVRWLLAGGDIYGLSKHLGHTSVKTTEIYLAYLPAYEESIRHTAGTMPPLCGDQQIA